MEIAFKLMINMEEVICGQLVCSQQVVQLSRATMEWHRCLKVAFQLGKSKRMTAYCLKAQYICDFKIQIDLK